MSTPKKQPTRAQVKQQVGRAIVKLAELIEDKEGLWKDDPEMKNRLVTDLRNWIAKGNQWLKENPN